MYYVPDGTKECGFYECKKCGNRFLSLQTMNRIPCPECEAEIDYEIGPDESMEDALDTAELLEKIIGEEEVEKMDGLLSLAIILRLSPDWSHLPYDHTRLLFFRAEPHQILYPVQEPEYQIHKLLLLHRRYRLPYLL